MQLSVQEVLLLFMVAGTFFAGVSMVYKSARHTAGEKLYWYFILFIFNILGVAAYLFDYFLLKKSKV